MTLFGNPISQQQPTTGSIFGNTLSSQQQPAMGGGLFGGTTQQPSTGGGLFGSTTPSAGTGGNIFGNGAQPTGTGGIFGSSTNATANTISTPSLFGQPAAQASTSTTQPVTTGSIFGTNTISTPSLFGQPAVQGSTSTTQSATTGSIFGSGNTTGTTSLFGQPAAQASTGSIFGSGTGTTSLFGQPAAQGSATTQPTTLGSIFGSSNTPGSTINPFGQATAQSQPTTSLFGQPTQSQQPQKPAGSLFGSTAQPLTTGTLFGSTLPAPTLGAGSILGTSTPRPTQSTFGGTVQQQDPHSQIVALMQRIDAIAEAWNPNSPQCRFQHYFYNLVDPAVVNQYGRPANATNEALWQRAVRENPNPSCMVPALAVGFDALNARVEAQSAQANAQQEKLQELKRRLQALTATHTDTTLSRLHRALSQHTQLSQRILRLVQHLHLLIPAVRSSSIRPEEEALRVALEEMEEDLRKPGGMSKMKSKLNELWALVGAINAARERGKKAGGEGAVEWTVVDEEGLKQITQILSDQQAGLQHLTKILQQDLKDLGVIMGTNGDREDGHANADRRFTASPSLLSSSTSTLHASALR